MALISSQTPQCTQGISSAVENDGPLPFLSCSIRNRTMRLLGSCKYGKTAVLTRSSHCRFNPHSVNWPEAFPTHRGIQVDETALIWPYTLISLPLPSEAAIGKDGGIERAALLRPPRGLRGSWLRREPLFGMHGGHNEFRLAPTPSTQALQYWGFDRPRPPRLEKG